MNKKAKTRLTFLSTFIFVAVLIFSLNFFLAGIPTSDLVSYYQFDEQDTTGTGTIIDIHGTNNGTNVGASNTSGILETAYDFDGTNDYVDLNTEMITEGQEFTLNAWVEPDVVNAYQFVISQSADSAGRQRASIRIENNGKVTSFTSEADGTQRIATSTTTLVANNWYMLTAVRNSTSICIYVNGGSPENCAVWDGTDISNSNEMWIGIRASPSSNVFPMNGKIDEVAIYNGAKTEAQISDLYNSGSPPSYSDAANSLPNVTLESPEDESTKSSPLNFSFTPTDDSGFLKAELFINTSTELTFGSKQDMGSLPADGESLHKIVYVDANDSDSVPDLFVPQLFYDVGGGTSYFQSNLSRNPPFNDPVTLIVVDDGAYHSGTDSVEVADLDGDGTIDVVSGTESRFVAVRYGNSSKSPPFNIQYNSSDFAPSGTETDYTTIGRASSEILYDIFTLAESGQIYRFTANNSLTGFKYNDPPTLIDTLPGGATKDSIQIITAKISNSTRDDIFLAYLWATDDKATFWWCQYNNSEADLYNDCINIANSTEYPFQNAPPYDEGTGFEATNRSMDINRDNISDIVYANKNETLLFLSNDSKSTYFNDPIRLNSSIGGIFQAHFYDWNNDDVIDLYVIDANANEVWVYEGNLSAETYFNNPINLTINGDARAYVGLFIDGNQDGVEDLILGETVTGDFGLYYYEGSKEGWTSNVTNSSSIINNTINNLSASLSNGTYKWNIKVTDSDSQSIFALSNRTITIGETATDTCTYSSGNWEVDCSDNCSITSDVNVGGNNITFTNSGHFSISSTTDISNFGFMIIPVGCEVRIADGGSLIF